jgi:hypothetical protein
MRTFTIAIVLAFGCGLISCTRQDQPSARQAGRDAYDATREVKQGAKKAAHEIREAGKDFREGWAERRSESKDPDPPQPKKQEPRRRN